MPCVSSCTESFKKLLAAAGVDNADELVDSTLRVGDTEAKLTPGTFPTLLAPAPLPNHPRPAAASAIANRTHIDPSVRASTSNQQLRFCRIVQNVARMGGTAWRASSSSPSPQL